MKISGMIILIVLAIMSSSELPLKTVSQQTSKLVSCQIVDGVAERVAKLDEQVTTLRCNEQKEPSYKVIPLDEYIFTGCSMVNLVRNSDGTINFSDKQPDGCIVTKIPKCTPSEIGYIRWPIGATQCRP